VLSDVDLRESFDEITGNLRLGVGMRVRRRGWVTAGAGVGLEIAGVIVRTYGRDAGQVSGSGGSSSATHIGNALLFAGLAAAALGALLALAGPALYGGTDRARPGLWLLRLMSPVMAVVLVVAGIVAAQRTVTGKKSATTVVSTTGPSAAAAPAGVVSTNPDVARAAAIPDVPLDPATRIKLADQLTLARQAAMQFPTVADATRAGMWLAGGFAPGSGAHYMSMKGVSQGIGSDGQVDPRYPASFIYDGISPTSRVVGLMYISLGGGAVAPEGFAGPNDHWHRHFNLCVIYGNTGVKVPFPADSDITAAQCAAVHGDFMKQTVWMIHAWVVPGWESPDGVFSHANPDLRCADGTFDANAQGFCQGT
jgi:hypothetical protein